MRKLVVKKPTMVMSKDEELLKATKDGVQAAVFGWVFGFSTHNMYAVDGTIRSVVHRVYLDCDVNDVSREQVDRLSEFCRGYYTALSAAKGGKP